MEDLKVDLLQVLLMVGAGGGAGGFLSGTGHAVSAHPYSIVVGGGGRGMGRGERAAGDGSSSVFDTFTAYGGGGGSYGSQELLQMAVLVVVLLNQEEPLDLVSIWINTSTSYSIIPSIYSRNNSRLSWWSK